MGLDGFRVSVGFGEKDSFREYVRTACRGSYNATKIPSGLEFGGSRADASAEVSSGHARTDPWLSTWRFMGSYK